MTLQLVAAAGCALGVSRNRPENSKMLYSAVSLSIRASRTFFSFSTLRKTAPSKRPGVVSWSLWSCVLCVFVRLRERRQRERERQTGPLRTPSHQEVTMCIDDRRSFPNPRQKQRTWGGVEQQGPFPHRYFRLLCSALLCWSKDFGPHSLSPTWDMGP